MDVDNCIGNPLKLKLGEISDVALHGASEMDMNQSLLNSPLVQGLILFTQFQQNLNGVRDEDDPAFVTDCSLQDVTACDTEQSDDITLSSFPNGENDHLSFPNFKGNNCN